MGVVLSILKGYMVVLMVLLIAYTFRHYIFSFNRLLSRQKMYYQDIMTSEPKRISILIPMYNEELVLHNCLDSLLECDYDQDYMEIIPINDNSSDRTKELLDKYAAEYDFIKPLHRNSPNRGKPAGLNDAMELATGEIILVFDADYRPAKDILRQLTVAFEDPHVGAVMGRVIPYNTGKNLLTRLLNIERSGGYQVDQQARYNLNLVPQYGGTVGGFRKDVMLELGGFNTDVLAEDTELTLRLFTNGYRVIYANSAECYEESPETYTVRAKQIRRWARGHNQVLFRYFFKTLRNPSMNFLEKIDAMMLLLIYTMPLLLLIGKIDSIILFFAGSMNLFSAWWVILFLGVYSSFGNFAPFFQIGTALLLDGLWGEILLLPMLIFNFYFYMWHISMGVIDAIVDAFTKRTVKWAKTQRFLDEKKDEPTLETDKSTKENSNKGGRS
ncbi:Glycosyltransferase, catalytic subunit of cellulose synthase and poly-beta-1,6-N-acetylglucosamine synthase [Granulicatella balaenopterae]|uniref:Glycosyltransferase, catalytic subunit of cellulose synthase and poly-beta-1,6-N-acetylglucosamine synthase n=1 Tax=Granulicatella balaenopterae TaxID=137733 RepID=A0A1H9KXE4_9LACT|nr:glycosyltransferase [Granulicatella balaenopterae]SER03826.1 Glycosyltransferase, catalytic subunit of cellulose synthase and poly-beta-1,6-N-acetylglucosamine synthase [Granulicatella balaenopterae]